MTTWNFCKGVKLKLTRLCALSLAILFTGPGASSAPQEPWFGTLGNGKFDGWRDTVSAMALPFGIFTGCSSPAGSSPQNVAPTANAGSDKNITLPTDSVTLDGGASSDSDGNIASYEWTQISKPSGAPDAVISTPTGSSTGVSGLTAVGKYTFQLKVTDNDGAESTDAVDVTVAAAANVAPTASAGSDQSITLPTDSVTLDGGASSDSDGNIASYEWTQISKPSGASDAVISAPANSSTGVSGLTAVGKYTFQLKVTDNDGAESTDAVDVNVAAATNVAPTASAGSDQSITLPTDSVTLDGSASSDSDGNIASYEWTQISKPSGAPDAVISAPANSSTGVSGLTAVGKYTFQLKVTDNDGAESTDAVDVTVAAAANVAPTASAGSDLSINVSTATSVTLDGSASGDSDGSIAAYEWTLLSKPNGAPDVTINNSTSATATASNLTKIGIYKFQLKVTDNAGAENVDAVNVTVKETKTADVTVKANNFTAGATLNFVPDYEFAGAGASYFNASDITYTLSSTNPEVDLSDCTDDGLVPASKYSNMNTPAITQVFYYNDQEIGRRSIVSVVAGGTSFTGIYDASWNALSEIPAAGLQQISKEVSE
jgi:ribosomal protein L14